MVSDAYNSQFNIKLKPNMKGSSALDCATIKKPAGDATILRSSHFRHALSRNSRPNWAKFIIRLKVIVVVSTFAMSLIRPLFCLFAVTAAISLVAVGMRA
ncbi:hypothetical protein [Mesorhizobium sp.]|uniref:hypothetical protein n=1 Tax=Mesorhizobium sp. TaxID=1871066 RepID=UPI000FE9EC93|nr:hypothetical protein [Mesorhizobium sp.]RWI23908.1 MAG: hypothetical protein EOQ92_14560 [Mesorhizobium sp.]RWK47931.1 MAG: hypothetical protein EOR47_20025 [Mesorhizobium sp.]RWK89710.1 MAG: hypothetical protein EOR45_28535 [Mesorhizobium sp.]RWK93700.1 MAG: hypothetical protein EOR53_21605 [Mesorhizobium sp.]TIP57091.1 MAG: hypothetical protein E5X56_21640 [Mesorhizobium sp.]